MKKFLGYISILVLTLLTLVSCSGKSVEKLYKAEGVDLGKDTVYKLVTADELVNIKNGTDEIVYCFYGSAKNFDSKSAILTIQNQAKQYKIDVIYYVNADDYNTSAENRKKVQEKLSINDGSVVPNLFAYNCEDLNTESKKYIFDLSKAEYSRHFRNEEDKIDYTLLAGFMFREKCNPEELPNL